MCSTIMMDVRDGCRDVSEKGNMRRGVVVRAVCGSWSKRA
jgi:hypothetical protein